MSLLKKFFQKEEKSKGAGCCNFNLEEEISKLNTKEEEAEKSSCCDFDLDAEISKVKDKKKSCCG